jgi:6-phosphogluconolactonase
MMHVTVLFFAATAALCTLALGMPAMAKPGASWVYVAGRDAISLFRLDPASGKLEPQGIAAAMGAGFLAFSPDHGFLYATATEADEKSHKRIGAVAAFAVDRASGKLTLLNEQPSGGDGPCFVTVDPQGKNVLVANYASATVAVLPLDEDGKLKPASCVIQQTGSSVDPSRQRHAYAHSVNVDPAGHFAFVADLGADKLFIYRFDSAKGTLKPNAPPAVTLPPGSGPRHFTFDPAGRFAYLVNEMGGTVAVYSYDAATGGLAQVQLIHTLPEDFKGISTAAEVQVHPTGKFVYASNRLGTNFITIFSIDPSSGKLSLIGYQSTLGKTPRNFRIDPTGGFLIVANQESDSIVLFSIDRQTGKLTPVGDALPVKVPMCVKFLAMTEP